MGVGEVEIASCDHILCILLSENACHEMAPVCFNSENYCSCSWLLRKKSISNQPLFLLYRVGAHLHLFCKWWQQLYSVIFELLIVIILHVFCCLKMLSTRWYLCVSFLEIIFHALGCKVSIV